MAPVLSGPIARSHYAARFAQERSKRSGLSKPWAAALFYAVDMPIDRSKTLTLYAFTCGWFQAPTGFFVEGGEKTFLRTPIPAYLIDHPRGRALFDTGLSKRFIRAFADKLPSDTPGFDFDESAEIAARLRAVEVDPASIQWIINSHFHVDHCGGNASIPNATIIVQAQERPAARVAMDAGSKAYDAADFTAGHPVLAISGEHDLFGDGSVVVFPTAGHTPGHQSVRLKLQRGDVVLAADCCYLERSLNELRVSPGDVDREASLATLRRLASMREGGTQIFYGHDPAFWKTIAQAHPIR